MVDFGSITEAYTDITRAGTPSYLAPERFVSAPISEQTELYAIGVTLYEALSKKYPFGEIEAFQTPNFTKIVKLPSSLNSKVPAWFESVIMRSLEVDTDKRYNNYSEMLFEINNPNEVKIYLDKSKPFVSRNECSIDKIGFVSMFILNIVQLIWF